MGSLDVDTFWVGYGWFFFGSLGEDGDGVGDEHPVTRSRTTESFSMDDTCFQTTPFLCYIFYRISGGFTTSCFKTIGNGVPDPRYSGQTRTMSVSTT
jgi:hypothetical protein